MYIKMVFRIFNKTQSKVKSWYSNAMNRSKVMGITEQYFGPYVVFNLHKYPMWMYPGKDSTLMYADDTVLVFCATSWENVKTLTEKHFWLYKNQLSLNKSTTKFVCFDKAEK